MALVHIVVSEKARVFLLEDSIERVEWFAGRVPTLVWAKSADAAIDTLARTDPFDFVFLDHDLGLEGGDGQEVAKHLAATGFVGWNTVIHSWNPSGAAAMKDILRNAIVIPFGKFDIELVS